jgi:hypothetical protein
MNEILAPKIQEVIREIREGEKKLRKGEQKKSPY